MTKNLFLVAIGGGFGSVLRFLISYFSTKNFPYLFPIGTFAVNIIGALIIGIIFGFFTRSNQLSSNWHIFLTTGFCGGFTTFSTFSMESINFIQEGKYMIFFAYVFGTILIGFGVTILAYHIAKAG